MGFNVPRAAMPPRYVIVAPPKYMDVLDVLRDGRQRTTREVAEQLCAPHSPAVSMAGGRLRGLLEVGAVECECFEMEDGQFERRSRYLWRITEAGMRATYDGQPRKEGTDGAR